MNDLANQFDEQAERIISAVASADDEQVDLLYDAIGLQALRERTEDHDDDAVNRLSFAAWDLEVTDKISPDLGDEQNTCTQRAGPGERMIDLGLALVVGRHPMFYYPKKKRRKSGKNRPLSVWFYNQVDALVATELSSQSESESNSIQRSTKRDTPVDLKGLLKDVRGLRLQILSEKRRLLARKLEIASKVEWWERRKKTPHSSCRVLVYRGMLARVTSELGWIDVQLEKLEKASRTFLQKQGDSRVTTNRRGVDRLQGATLGVVLSTSPSSEDLEPDRMHGGESVIH